MTMHCACNNEEWECGYPNCHTGRRDAKEREPKPEPPVQVPRDTLKRIRRELHACQAVIHLAGGFDPAYVEGAQASLKEIDALLGE